MKPSLFMRRLPDPNPDGYTRFRDFCMVCGKGIQVGQRVHRDYKLDGDLDFTHETCLNEQLLGSLQQLNGALEELVTHISSSR